MSDKKKDEKAPSQEADKGTASREYVRKKWVDKDPEIVPEQCQTGRCGHKEHRIEHETSD